MRIRGLRSLFSVALSSLCLLVLATPSALAALTVTSFSPSSGPAGTVVTITGTGFSSTKTLNSITIGNKAITPSAATATQLTCAVPNDAQPGARALSVTVGGVTATATGTFTISPTITSFTPTSGLAGTQVTIYGANFSTNPYVKFTGVFMQVAPSTVSATALVATVPAGASTGPITVLTSAGNGPTVVSSTSFVVPQPAISGFSPASGPEGTQVTISGSNFDPNTPANNGVTFNGVAATVTAATASAITVTVPSGASTGLISVSVAGNSGNSASSFTVTPAITSFYPASGNAGTTVYITGTTFGATPTANTVKFNGITATVTAANATSITATVPSGATTGLITVTANGQTGPSASNFFVLPAITSFTPTAGPTGTSVTITGTNFSATPAQNAVQFVNAPSYMANATVTAATPTSLTVTVPGNLPFLSYSITVSVQGGPVVTASGTYLVANTPTITSFTPALGPVGTSVVISGSGFSGTPSANTVKFNGTAATVTAANGSSLTATVPSGATTGPITVTVNTMTATSASNYTVGTTLPTITSFSPTSGIIGTQVTVIGTQFANTALLGSVKINGVLQMLTGGDDSSLVFNVVSGTTTGPITAALPNGTSVTSSGNFTVLAPTITSLSSTSGSEGTQVIISGTNFSPTAAADAVKFNGVSATVTAATSTSLTVTVPAGATTGPITVNVGGLTATSGTFTVTPAITSFGPTSGRAGDIVLIYGTTFGATPAANVVKFNNTTATVNVASTTALQVVVPAGATTGSITVTANGQTASSGTNYFYVLPTITSFTPTAGPATTGITITGANFSATPSQNLVQFVSLPSYTLSVTVTAATTTSLTVAVPNGLPNGNYSITVSVQGGPTVTSANTFLIAPKPQIDSFSPTLAPPNVNVIVSGSGFSTTPSANVVKFNGVQATVSAATASSLTVTVPAAATTGQITVLVNQQLATSQGIFTLGLPAPASMTVPAITDWPTISISWDPSQWASFYKIDTQAPDGIWYNIENIHYGYGGTQIQFLSDFYGPNGYAPFINHNTYKFRVRACLLTNGGAGQLCSAYTESSGVYFDIPPPPVAPTLVKLPEAGTAPQLQVIAGALFEVDWLPSISGGKPKFYDIYYTPKNPNSCVNDPICYQLEAFIEAGDNWPSATFIHAKYAQAPDQPGTYYIGVDALNGGGRSSVTMSPTKLIVIAGQIPSAPPSVTVPAATSGPILVKWVASQSTGPNAAKYYKVQRLATGATQWIDVNTNVLVPQTSLTDTVNSNGYYSYRVSACNNNGCSTWTQSTRAVHVVLSNGPLPSVAITSPHPGDTFTAPVDIPINATVSVTGDSITKVEFYNGVDAAPVCPPTASSTCLWTNPGARNYPLYAIAYGSMGGITSSDYVGVTVKNASGLVALGSPVLDALPIHDARVGTMNGQAGTDGGAAMYTIPIVAPPGRAGMQPSLALSYSSRSGNGVMGMGWSISGLSSIHRCPQTPEQDGQAVAVSYLSSDRLCLDGQRLLLAPTSTAGYGQSGAVYSTEIDSYARITQVGGDIGSGDNACFLVEEKNGRILHYGGVITGSSCPASTRSSRVKPGGALRALSWLVEKIADRVGNNQFYTYADKGNGEVLPSKIEYTGSNGSPGDRHVDFSYALRTSVGTGDASDISSSYLAGGLTMQTQALASVTTWASGTKVRTYTPDYKTLKYSGRLSLIGMTECAPDATIGTCHPETTFAYNDGDLNFAPTNLSAIAPAAETGYDPNANQIFTLPDFDGDGTRETLVTTGFGANLKSYLLPARADHLLSPSTVDVTAASLSTMASNYADIDGDGRAEMLRFPLQSDPQFFSLGVWKGARGTTPSSPATYSTLFNTVYTNIPYNSANARPLQNHGNSILATDMDGDGRPDIVFAQAAGCGTYNDQQGHPFPKTGIYVYLNRMTGSLADAVSHGQQAQFVPVSSSLSTSAPGLLFCLEKTESVTWIGHSVSLQALTDESIDHIADMDGDGVPDFVLNVGSYSFTNQAQAFSRIVFPKPTRDSSGSVTFTTSYKSCPQLGLNNDGSDQDECILQDTAPIPHNSIVTWTDVNGDGLEDFVIAQVKVGKWIVHLNTGATAHLLGGKIDTGSSSGLRKTIGDAAFRYAGKLPSMDVDGDGKPDMLIVSETQGSHHGFALKMCTLWVVPHLIGDNGACPSATSSSGSATSWDNLTITSGQGGVLAGCPVYACPEDPDRDFPPPPPPGGDPSAGDPLTMPANVTASTDGRYKFVWQNERGQDMPVTGTYKIGADDNSAYHLAMLKFVQTGPGLITTTLVETPLISRLQNAVGQSAQDIFGDGQSHLVTTLGCAAQVAVRDSGTPQAPPVYYNACSVVGKFPDGISYGPTTLPDGSPACDPNNGHACQIATQPKLFANVNQGVTPSGPTVQSRIASLGLNDPLCPVGTSAATAEPVLPGLMNSATNGLVDQAQWGYDTLAWGRLCKRDGVPIYTTQNSDGSDPGYADSRHFYFSSTMPVVTGMLQSNGVGDALGFRSAMYSYGQAIYNHLGRGFQGFRTIASETAPPDLDRRTRTTTTFNQKFPLAGKVAEVDVVVPKTGKLVHQEIDNWACPAFTGNGGAGTRDKCPQDPLGTPAFAPTQNTIYRPVLNTQVDKSFDMVSGKRISEVDTDYGSTTNASVIGWDPYGNATGQTVTAVDYNDASPSFISSHKTTTASSYVSADITNWWVDQLDNSVVTAIIAYDPGHPLPVANPSPETITTRYSWNAADRTLSSKTLQTGTNNHTQSVTTYIYNTPTSSFGQPTQVSVTMPDVAGPLSPTRTTGYAYTADGYFVARTTQDPAGLNRVVTTSVRSSDGQVTDAVDPNNERVHTDYDVFGRAIAIARYGSDNSAIASPQQISFTACTSEGCEGGYDENAFEQTAAYRITTVQDGYPTQVAWFDLLGREIKHAMRGYTGEFIETHTDYDAMGTVEFKWAPMFARTVNADQGVVHYSYDALSRPTQKLSHAADLDSTHGDFVTQYSYNGRLTTIWAGTSAGACSGQSANLCMTMYRSTNVLGQMMQTIDANGKPTNFWTDPLGHVIAISDPEGNVIEAKYNELGQRTASKDPDQGTWTFAYDAGGELLTQTDARGVITSVLARDALGRTTQQQQTPQFAWPGLANESLFDTWAYDTANNGVGKLASVTRQRGSGAPASNPTVWSEQYHYDSAGRPNSIDTTINEGSSVSLHSGMSYDAPYGRLSTHTYPSGLVLQYGYSPYGQLGSYGKLNTDNTVSLYWEASGMDEWGGISNEVFLDGTTGSRESYASTGQERSAVWTNGANTLESLNYTYDTFGNLKNQARASAGTATNSETYTYDSLQRLIGTSRWPIDANHPDVGYSYSDSGNLLSKSDFASSYTYGANGCGPHAVSAAGGNTYSYSCDKVGNVISGGTSAIPLAAVYDADNHPRSITRGSGQMTWAYDTNGQRDYETSSAGTRYFGPNGYEQIGAKQIHEIGPVIVTRNGATDTVSVALRDRLGSTIRTIDGASSETRAYDAFGKVRNGDFGDRANGTLNLGDTIHGFTEHEHADDVQLINMGGRVYDYQLGRFLNVDPIIQNAANGQNLNPYSYVGNNPLSGTDPTGYFDCDEHKKCTGTVGEIDKISRYKDGTITATNKDGQTITLGNISEKGVQTSVISFIANSLTNGGNLVQGSQGERQQSSIESVSSRFTMTLSGQSPGKTGDPVSGGIHAIFDPWGASQYIGEKIGLLDPIDPGQFEADRKAFDHDYKLAATIATVLNPKRLIQGLEKKAVTKGGTYVLKDAEDVVVRCGRSCDLARRELEHARDPRLKDLTFEAVHQTDVRAEQRGLEQMLHDQYKPAMDRINPISPANPNKPGYMDAARQYLEREGGG